MRARREPKNKAKKNKKGIPKKPQHVFFSRVRPDHPRCRSATWICMCGHTRDPIIYSKFYRNPFRGFGAPGGVKIWPFPLLWLVTFTIDSLYYRTSRDRCKLFYVLPTALAGKLMHPVMSVCPSVCFHSYLLNRLTFRLELLCIQYVGHDHSSPEIESQG